MAIPRTIGPKVLIVDDEQIVVKTLAHIFENSGYEVQGALSATLALKLVSTWTPNAAILDVSLAITNGIELAILITEQCPDCHVLLFSGRPESGDLVDRAAAGGNVFELLAKPVHPSTLLAWTARKLSTL